MATFTFNIGKGRIVELYNRVENNDPSTSAFIMIPLATSGLEAQSTLEDADTFAAVVSGATNEAVGTGWARKTITDSDLAALPAPDDTNNRYAIDLPDQTWSNVSNGSEDISSVVVCYDANTGSGSDSDLIPLTHHDFVIQPDDSDVTMTITDFFRAS